MPIEPVWSLTIEDPNRVIDRNVIGLGSIFKITLDSIVIQSFCSKVDTKRDAKGFLTYTFSGGIKKEAHKSRSNKCP